MQKDSSQNSLPLGRVFRLKELKGWFGKTLKTPPGRQGVVLEASGKQRLLPPGGGRVIGVWERLRGRGAGLAAGYVPQGAFLSAFKFRLLSGDLELLDLTLAANLQVADPLRFFSQVVLPQGEVHASGFSFGDDAAQQALAAVLRQYAAEDLAQGAPPRLHAELLGALQTLSAARGLAALDLPLAAISRAEDRALIAEKTQELEERLGQVELEKKLSAVETQAQLEEFIESLDPDLQKMVQFNASGEKGGGLAAAGARLGEAVRSWLTIETSKEGGTRRWRFEGLLRKSPQETPAKQAPTHRTPKYWWLPRGLLMASFLLSGFLLTQLINWIADKASWDSRLEVILIVWGIVISVILESVKALYEKRESMDEAAWRQPGFQLLDDLVRNNRPWADELVRRQCHNELQHVLQTLQEVRSRAYKRGETDLALRLRNEVERSVADCAEKVLRPDYGRPPYLTDLHISRQAWNDMLDFDEDLLLFANALSEKAHQAQEASHAGGPQTDLLADLERDVLNFCAKFFERGRPLKTPPAQS